MDRPSLHFEIEVAVVPVIMDEYVGEQPEMIGYNTDECKIYAYCSRIPPFSVVRIDDKQYGLNGYRISTSVPAKCRDGALFMTGSYGKFGEYAGVLGYVIGDRRATFYAVGTDSSFYLDQDSQDHVTILMGGKRIGEIAFAESPPRGCCGLFRPAYKEAEGESE